MQFRHAVRLRSLEAHDHHTIAIEGARFERFHDVFLIVEHDSGCFDDAMLRLHRRGLDHRTTEIAL